MKYNKSVFQSLSLISQFGFTMLVPILLCALVGWYIDEKLGTGYWFVVLFFVGALAGFRNIYILARKIYQDKDEEEER